MMQPSQARAAKKHVILFLAANPRDTGRLALDREARSIHVELKRSGHRDRFDFVTRWAAEPLDLLRELRELKPTIVHFSGHGARQVATADRVECRDVVGNTAPSGGGPTGVVFDGANGGSKVVTPEAFAQTLDAAGASVRLVVLNACYTASIAEALLTHVDCVVGMSGAIHDDASRSFAIGFYGGLGERESVAAAYKQGLAAIGLEGAPEGEQPRLISRDGIDAYRVFLIEPSGTDADAAAANPPATSVGSSAAALIPQVVGETFRSTGRGRTREVARVPLDMEKSDALDRASLSAVLDRITDAARLADLQLALDADALQRELREIWSDAPSCVDSEPAPAALTPKWRQYLQDRRDDEARLQIVLPISLENLSDMLTAACEGMSASLPSSAWLGHEAGSCLQRLTGIALCQFWEGVSQCTPRDRIRGMTSVNGGSVLALVDKLKSLQLESLSSTPASYMYVHELPEADLERVELRGRSGIADGSAWVPVTTILEDTRKYWQFGASPPSGEILAQDWVRFFIPGLAAYSVRIARNHGQRLRDAQLRVSLRIDAYAHLGPP
jgi:hypothetical protein